MAKDASGGFQRRRLGLAYLGCLDLAKDPRSQIFTTCNQDRYTSQARIIQIAQSIPIATHNIPLPNYTLIDELVWPAGSSYLSGTVTVDKYVDRL